MEVKIRRDSKIRTNQPQTRLNESIRAEEVRLIASDGSQRGIVSYREALELARGEDLDLVEISPKANPPVCKVMDYGKFKFDKEKKDKRDTKKAESDGTRP